VKTIINVEVGLPGHRRRSLILRFDPIELISMVKQMVS
jgi:hypothetical protein